MRAIAWSTAAVAVLVLAYLALGGASYAPAKVADPCATRDWRGPQGFQEVAQQIVLSALDGAACDLHVSREDMVLALASKDSREQFVRAHGISNQRLSSSSTTGSCARSTTQRMRARSTRPWRTCSEASSRGCRWTSSSISSIDFAASE